jgi:hypothetical protein
MAVGEEAGTPMVGAAKFSKEGRAWVGLVPVCFMSSAASVPGTWAETGVLLATTGAGEPDTGRREDNKRPSSSKPIGLLNRFDANKFSNQIHLLMSLIH